MITTLLIALAPAITEAAPVTPPVLAPLDPALLSLNQDADMTAPEWTGSVSLSAISTEGNTKTNSISADANAQLRRDVDRFTVKAYWNYATDKASGTKVITARKVGTSLQYDYFVTEDEKTYVYGNTGADYDSLSGLDGRYLFGVGAGRQFTETDELKLSAEVGLNYVVEDFVGAATDDYAAARLAGNLYKQLSEDTNLTSSIEVYPSLEDMDDVYGKLDSKISTSLSEAMFASFQWVLDFDNTPASGADRVDQRLVFALGWSF